MEGRQDRQAPGRPEQLAGTLRHLPQEEDGERGVTENPQPWKTFVLFIPGFTEREGQSSGTFKQFARASAIRRQLGVTDARVELRTWNSRWKETARYIERTTTKNARIFVVAYSWGGGWGFPRLALHLLGKREIRQVVLCDAVYRSDVLPSRLPFNPLSLSKLPTIRVPRNVMSVRWLRRASRDLRPADASGRRRFRLSGLIRGHRVVAEDAILTDVQARAELAVGHSEIDETEEFAREVDELLFLAIGYRWARRAVQPVTEAFQKGGGGGKSCQIGTP